MPHFLPHAWSDKMSDRAQREFSDESASCFELCDQTISFSESNTSTTVTTITATAEASESCSLLSVLRAPKPSDLAKVTSNPPTGKKRCKGRVASEPSSVEVRDRITQFPDEPFSTSGNKLFCKACREPLSVKKNIIVAHIKSAKHFAGLRRLDSKQAICQLNLEMLISI